MKLNTLTRFRMAAIVAGAASVNMFASSNYKERLKKARVVIQQRAAASLRTVDVELIAEYKDRAIGQALIFSIVAGGILATCEAAVHFNNDPLAIAFTVVYGALWCGVQVYGEQFADKLRQLP